MEQESLAPKGIQQTSPVLSPLPQARKPDEQNHSPEKIERRKEPVQNPMQELARVQPRPQALDQEVREGDRRADPEPTVVRVTIGRIEVRAIMPAVPPVEVPAKPAPKLSLDEYLRKQSGRRP
jgi:hypothetical protein